MVGVMRRCVALILALLGTAWRVEASCIDPSTLVHSAVGITREFTAEEQAAAPGILGIRGTGWFLSAQSVVTAAHVAEAMHLSPQGWTTVELRDGASTLALPARLAGVVGAHAEKMAVIELRKPFPGAAPLSVRTAPLVPEESVSSLAYPNDRLRLAKGRFVEYGTDSRFTGAALLEMHDGNDRLVLDHGASGAPVLDCEGRVVAVVSTLMTTTLSLPTGPVRVSTAWQTPNVLSIPAADLAGLSRTE
jgi:hypothetical protein